MTPDPEKIRAAGEALFCPAWQAELARALGLGDPRRVMEWLALTATDSRFAEAATGSDAIPEPASRRNTEWGNEMVMTHYIEKDHYWHDEATIYWFRLSGYDAGTEIGFDSDVYGIRESGQESSVVDADGCPINDGDGLAIAVRRACVVTDEMRMS